MDVSEAWSFWLPPLRSQLLCHTVSWRKVWHASSYRISQGGSVFLCNKQPQNPRGVQRQTLIVTLVGLQVGGGLAGPGWAPGFLLGSGLRYMLHSRGPG